MVDEEAHMAVTKKEEELELELESEEEEEDYEISTSPKAVNWFEGGFWKGVMLLEDDALLLLLLHSKSNSSKVVTKKRKIKDSNYDYTCCQAFDGCSICLDPLSSDGSDHRLCSLPCGHIYGRPCIIKSLQQDQISAGKCPQCYVECTLKDVRPLYGTHLSIAKHWKASSSSTTTIRHFQFTKDGYKALKKHVLQRKSFALQLESVYSNRHADVLRRVNDASDRLYVLSKQRGELPKSRTGSRGQGQEADAFQRQALSLAMRCDLLDERAYALGKQVRAFRRLNAVYLACIDYFEDVCKRCELDEVLVED